MANQQLNEITDLLKAMNNDPNKANDEVSLAKLAEMLLVNDIKNLISNYKHGFNALMDDLAHVRRYEQRLKEMAAIRANGAEPDPSALHELCTQIYGTPEAMAHATLGGDNARVLQDAVDVIKRLRTRIVQLEGLVADIP